jgi:cysteine desulfurase/selenocysteine lyase
MKLHSDPPEAAAGPPPPASDLAWTRADFPILNRTVHGKPLIFLDSAASSQKPRQVVEAMSDYYYHHHANVHRGAYLLSTEATGMYEAARRKVATFLNAPSADSVIFLRNTTEALNLVAWSWARANLQAGDEIIISVAEHHANLVPWHMLAAERGVVLRPVGLTPDHRFDLEAFRALLGKRTKLVSTFHMSNVLGTINPLREIAALTHEAGALLLADGAQAAPHLPVDVQELGVDFYAISGHKMCGPTGAGALWVREEVLQDMPPFLGGGEMISRVKIDGSSYAGIPDRFEAGTPAIAEAIGLGAAVDYLSSIGMQAIHEHDRHLLHYALGQLRPLEGITLHGPEGSDRGGIISFTVDGAHPHDVASALDAEGIAVRAGKHCAHPLLEALDVPASVRASFYFYNTEHEVDRFVEELVRIRDFFALPG